MAGDCATIPRSDCWGACFNPRPPISWRATARIKAIITGAEAVSIHAHQFHGGRPCGWSAGRSGQPSFQSTPTNFMAGDRLALPPHCRPPGFNPRPPISWRATFQSVVSASGSGSFNPRPPISWRATRLCRAGGAARAVVSIHAHQFHGGRRRPARGPLAARRFNPRPPISWRATSATACSASAESLFQSTPTNFMAGDAGQQRPDHRAGVSIHAHQFHGGRLKLLPAVNQPGCVSIHAHQFHGGRHPVTLSSENLRLFQSTPTNFMAGDARVRPVRCHAAGGFNPRPPISWRATRRCRARTASRPGFNPRPPISWRATTEQHGTPVVDVPQFQSTPTNFMAGDVISRAMSGAPVDVSIHAHQFHGGRPTCTASASPASRCFNPRPPISWRATVRAGVLAAP